MLTSPEKRYWNPREYPRRLERKCGGDFSLFTDGRTNYSISLSHFIKGLLWYNILVMQERATLSNTMLLGTLYDLLICALSMIPENMPHNPDPLPIVLILSSKGRKSDLDNLFQLLWKEVFHWGFQGKNWYSSFHKLPISSTQLKSNTH